MIPFSSVLFTLVSLVNLGASFTYLILITVPGFSRFIVSLDKTKQRHNQKKFGFLLHLNVWQGVLSFSIILKKVRFFSITRVSPDLFSKVLARYSEYLKLRHCYHDYWNYEHRHKNSFLEKSIEKGLTFAFESPLTNAIYHW